MDSDEMTPAQVAREFKVSAQTVRRWEERDMLKPTRRLPRSNYRRYSREDIERFKRRLDAGEFDEKVSA